MKKLTLIILCLLSFIACDKLNFTKSVGVNLVEAEQAIASFDLIQAEKILDRILKDETEPSIRYQAYLKLIELSKLLYSDERWAIEYLEAMSSEFTKKSELRYILTNLALNYEAVGDSDNASKNWFRLIDEIELDDVELANIYNHISRSYFLSSQFDFAEDMAQSCLNIAQDYDTQADCIYTLSQIDIINKKLDAAVSKLNSIYSNADTNPELKCRVALNLADSLEQLGSRAEALAIYKDILAEYPNPKLIELRIKNLESAPKK